MKTKTLTTIILLLTVFVSACTAAPQTLVAVPPQLEPITPLPTIPLSEAQEEPTKLPAQAEAQTTQLPSSTPMDFTVEAVAEGLDIPWEIAFLPDGDNLVTERPGSLIRIGQDRKSIPVEGVYHIGEGGLLGLTLHPDFENNATLYLYLTSQVDGAITNRVESYTLTDDRLENRTVILEGIPGAANHDGGRIEFGPDGYLYITTGDAGKPESAQDINSLAGKILRVTETGEIPADNPFQSPVYSYGHRNPQGLAWDDSGRLWSTEHGRSGFASGFDELNLVESGKNYGWPVIQGDETRQGMQTPMLHSGATNTWAPGDVEYSQGKLYFSGLRGRSLYVYDLDEGSSNRFRAYFEGDYGRLRAVRIGPDGFLYMTTSNRDGRGQPNEGDDKLLRINLDWLESQ